MWLENVARASGCRRREYASADEAQKSLKGLQDSRWANWKKKIRAALVCRPAGSKCSLSSRRSQQGAREVALVAEIDVTWKSSPKR